MSGLGFLEVFALLALSFVLIAVGILLVLLGTTASQGEGAVRSKGLVVLLLGPIPIIVSDGASFPLVMLLAVVLFLLVVFLVLRTTLRGHPQD